MGQVLDLGTTTQARLCHHRLLYYWWHREGRHLYLPVFSQDEAFLKWKMCEKEISLSYMWIVSIISNLHYLKHPVLMKQIHSSWRKLTPQAFWYVSERNKCSYKRLDYDWLTLFLLICTVSYVAVFSLSHSTQDQDSFATSISSSLSRE